MFRGILSIASQSTLLALTMLISAARIYAAPVQFGALAVDPDLRNTIILNGEIGPNSALDFRRAISANPNARVPVLNSPGGSIQIALPIADEVHQRGIATFIPAGSSCLSACALVFFAGKQRVVEGQLGVHQMSSEHRDNNEMQVVVADVLELLNRFETPTEVLTIMFRTPPEQMHIFSAEEIADLGINWPTQDALVSSRDPKDTESNTGAAPSRASPDLSDLPRVPPQLPARMAMYSGLDFYGADIRSEYTDNLAECAARCAALRRECRAFTFNVDVGIGRDNCFLKASTGIPDGNAVAVSGLLLNEGEPDPAPFKIGAIDWKQGLLADVDIP